MQCKITFIYFILKIKCGYINMMIIVIITPMNYTTTTSIISPIEWLHIMVLFNSCSAQLRTVQLILFITNKFTYNYSAQNALITYLHNDMNSCNIHIITLAISLDKQRPLSLFVRNMQSILLNELLTSPLQIINQFTV